MRQPAPAHVPARRCFAAQGLLLLACGLSACGLSACDEAAPPPWTPEEVAVLASLSPPGPPPADPSNRVADSSAAALLGQALFFDTALSANGKVACATCHVPEQYFSDGRPLSQGLGTTGRHAPSVLGAAASPFLFWDGRKDSLWAQALGPLESSVEHGISRMGLLHGIATRHAERWRAAFGPLPDLSDPRRFPAQARPVPDQADHPHQVAWAAMSEADRALVDRLAADAGKAIAAYERLLLPGLSPFDHYVKAVRDGDPAGGGHLSPAARRGLALFMGRGQCVACHNGPLLTDQAFHNLGLPRPEGASGVDLGRTIGADAARKDAFRCDGPNSDVPAHQRREACAELRFLNPRFVDFQGAFKTPSLRNVARTAPYMHDGAMATLEEVVAFYRTRAGEPLIGHRDLLLDQVPKDLPVADLVAFLETLTGPLPPAALLRAPTRAQAPHAPPGARTPPAVQDSAGQGT